MKFWYYFIKNNTCHHIKFIYEISMNEIWQMRRIFSASWFLQKSESLYLDPLWKIHAAGLPSNLGRNPAECRRSIPKFRRLSTARVLNYSAHGNRAVKRREQPITGALLQNKRLLPVKKKIQKFSMRRSVLWHWFSKEEQREAALLLFQLNQRIERGIDICW